MKLIQTGLPGCVVIEPRVLGDDRGHFYEAFRLTGLAGLGMSAFVQGNVSRSARGVLRGLHYQWPNPQGKLLSVVAGEVWDVAVDIRRGSPHYGRWAAVLLNAENRRRFWVPEGFAHGFVALSEQAELHYLCTAPYDREADAAIAWDDPALAIDWPVARPVLSARDASAPRLSEIPRDRLPPLPAA
ncbi:dTDP-4-dehydrorhamnose 3,5-epimerase [Lysobacter sp. GX 14042]|uniref:dTDP-4-dehydrorhamnose 3,5-epimerase n=1 Tax=Lysobacter sp. GX 14042 TaxID=2907155 RepID=UPI001F1B721B|nr:dTDP-4-dehydrorhamnose 3,5-epimerase [Lysobacter sp. GX 14042]